LTIEAMADRLERTPENSFKHRHRMSFPAGGSTVRRRRFAGRPLAGGHHGRKAGR
jgi:hypothetical protein